MTHNNTLKYINKLFILQTYNATYHCSIGTTPPQVNRKNKDLSGEGYTSNLFVPTLIFKVLYQQKSKVGDTVGLFKAKLTFEKGYTPNWTGELFIISESIPRRPYTVYRVKDLLGKKVAGTFYGAELQRVSKSTPDDTYRIEKFIKTKNTFSQMGKLPL